MTLQRWHGDGARTGASTAGFLQAATKGVRTSETRVRRSSRLAPVVMRSTPSASQASCASCGLPRRMPSNIWSSTLAVLPPHATRTHTHARTHAK